MKKFFILLLPFLAVILAAPLHARSNLIKAVGVGAGICLPQGGWDPGIAVTGQIHMGEAIKYLYFTPYLSYSRAVRSETINGQSEELSIQYMTLGAKMIGYINSKPQGFYAGGELSYNLITYDEIQWGELSQGTQLINSNTTKLGFSVLAGYLFKLRKLSIFVEADYMFTVGGFNNPRFLTGVDFDL